MRSQGQSYKPGQQAGGDEQPLDESYFTLMSLPSSSSTEMMPVSTKSVHGVKSVINLGFVWMYSLKNTAFINSLFYRIGRNGN